MFCTKCGNAVADGTKFCPKCGQAMGEAVATSTPVEETKVNETKVDETPVAEETKVEETVADVASKVEEASIVVPQANDFGEVKKEKSKKGLAIAAIIVVVVAALFAGGFFVFKMLDKKKRTFDVAEYITVKFEGYDGIGTATVYLDVEEFLDKVSDVTDLSSRKAEKEFKSAGKKDYDALTSFYDVIEWEVDKNTELSNGDKIKVKIKVDEEAAEEVGIFIEDAEKEFEVEKLEELREVDPFESVEVSFSGTYPGIEMNYENNGSGEFYEEFYVSYAWDYDEEADLKSGDKVTLKVEVTEEEAQQRGFKLTQTSKEYVIPELDSYITNIDEIPEEILNEMKDASKKVIDEYFEDYKDRFTCKDATYEGMYIVTSEFGNNNFGYVVFSGTVKAKDKKDFKPTKVYFPIYFEDLMSYAEDGRVEYSEISDYITGSYESGLESGWTTVKGFTDLQAMSDYILDWYDEEYYIIYVSDSLNPSAASTGEETETDADVSAEAETEDESEAETEMVTESADESSEEETTEETTEE